MTKTLTKQWRDGTLPDDTYYWKVCKENWIADKYEMYDYTKVCDVDKIECLAPVPSYDKVKEMSQKIGRLELDNGVLDDELKELTTKNDTLSMENGRLQKRLSIATKALKGVCVWANTGNGGEQAVKKVCEKALKEMEGVK